jgi:hypothetical protein
VYRLSTTLVSRLVSNLRLGERNSALVGVPRVVETERRFQAALPAVRSITFCRNTDVVRVDKSISGMASNNVFDVFQIVFVGVVPVDLMHKAVRKAHNRLYRRRAV